MDKDDKKFLMDYMDAVSFASVIALFAFSLCLIALAIFG